ncbi:MAG: hypothetical protein E7238_01385 [Sarcina sp.]|nr:hypothetical protein [Sarcina sp.]
MNKDSFPSPSDFVKYEYRTLLLFIITFEEGSHMKSQLRRRLSLHFIHLLLAFAIATALIPAVRGEASSGSKALQYYRTMLSQKTIKVLPWGKTVTAANDKTAKYWFSQSKNIKFSVAYINNDNTPDLILYDPFYGYGIWTYKSGKVKCLFWEDTQSEPIGYFKKKSIFRDNRYEDGTVFDRNYYKLESGRSRLIQYASCDGIPSGNKLRFEYHLGRSSKTVSEGRFYRNLSKYTGSSKMSQIYLHWNTKNNIGKFLK